MSDSAPQSKAKNGRGDPRRRRPDIPALLALATAPCLLGLMTFLVVVGNACGWDPLWPTERDNIAELAAMRNSAGVIQQRRLGADINARYPIRAGLLPRRYLVATPLEAAIFTREDWFVQFMLDNGAEINPDNRLLLTCTARELGATAIERLISGGRAINCGGRPD